MSSYWRIQRNVFEVSMVLWKYLQYYHEFILSGFTLEYVKYVYTKSWYTFTSTNIPYIYVVASKCITFLLRKFMVVI